MGLWAFVLCIPSPLWIGHCLGECLLPLTWPISPFVLCLWAGKCPYHATALLLLWYHLSFYLVVTSRLTGWSSCQSITYIFLLLGFTSQHSHWASLFHALGFLGPFPSSLPLSLPWIFANPLGFPGPITTSLSFKLIGLYSNPMNLLIPFLGFLGPFYLFSISYNSHGFTTSFLRLPRPICFLPGHLLFLWTCWPSFLLF